MKLINTTVLNDQFILRAFRWVNGQVGEPARQVKVIRIKNAKGFSGLATYEAAELMVRVSGSDKTWPWTHQYRKAAPVVTWADWVECFVHIMAHERWHLVEGARRKAWRKKNIGWGRWAPGQVPCPPVGDEPQCERVANQVLKAFRPLRGPLLTAWTSQESSQYGQDSSSVVATGSGKSELAAARICLEDSVGSCYNVLIEERVACEF